MVLTGIGTMSPLMEIANLVAPALLMAVLWFFLGPTLETAIALIPFTIVMTVLWLAVRPTFFRRLLSGMREKRLYRKGRMLAAGKPPPTFTFPYVIVAWSFFFVMGISFPPPALLSGSLDQIAELGRQYNSYRLLAMIPLVMAAVVIHLRPNHSRELKYTLVLILLPAVSLFATGAQTRDLFSGRSIETAHPTIAYSIIYAVVVFVSLAISLWYVFVFLALSLFASYWIKTGRVTRSSSGKIGFAFFRVRFFGPFMLLCGLAPDIAVVFLGGRYVLGEAFRRHPIVYLRSFRHEGAGKIFGRAIAPALAPFGVIRALVHESQTGRVLLSSTSIWQFGSLETVPDASWQSWVSDAVRSSSLAVIDCTVRTESVDWEIQTSLRELDAGRVLVMTTDQAPVVAANGATVSSYAADRGGIKRLRAQVTSWAGQALNINMRKAKGIAACVWLLVLATVLLRIFLVPLSVGRSIG